MTLIHRRRGAIREELLVADSWSDGGFSLTLQTKNRITGSRLEQRIVLDAQQCQGLRRFLCTGEK